ncbi:hypothetical protein VSR68_03315 [Paraburkholderia phymatum]|uniref:hypothetical protein n=1 Tax=Paraburkholderia phymatum TaxID=148447 RepID=UPI003177DEF4
MSDYVQRLMRMSAAELAAEQARANSRYQRTIEASQGRIVNDANGIPRRVYGDMPSEHEPMRAVKRKDATGRVITEYEGGSMDEWMRQFKTPVFRQVRICKDARDFTPENLYVPLGSQQ